MMVTDRRDDTRTEKLRAAGRFARKVCAERARPVSRSHTPHIIVTREDSCGVSRVIRDLV